MKKVIFLVIGILIYTGAITGYAFSNFNYAKDFAVADFKYDVNKLSEAAMSIEFKNKNNENSSKSSDEVVGKNVAASDINKDLKEALLKISDKNRDGVISDDELNALGLKMLNPDIYKKELEREQLSSMKRDGNLAHYLVITKGENAGTVLYNGKLKFIDSRNVQYFGLEIFK